VVLGATATTLMELAGVTDGNYDQLQVAGILEVGGALGHRNISTTSVYLHALDDGTVGSIFE